MNRRVLLQAAAAVLAVPARAEWQDVAGRPALFAAQIRDGATKGTAAYAGSPVLLHFWASWCASCRTEFPALDALQRDMAQDGLRVLAVSVDRLGWPVIERTAEALGVRSVTLLHDLNREAARALDIGPLPTSLLLDRHGRELARHAGTLDWSDPQVRARLRQLCAS